MFEVIKIKDLTLIFSPLKNIETASLGIFLNIGSRFESQKVKGIAHFLEHMVFKGSRSYSHLKIKREIEGRGGSLNAFTSQEITAYYAHFLKKNLARTLDILMDMVTNPSLQEKDMQRERNVILEEIKMYNDLPSSRAAMLIDKLLWPDHPLGEEVIGHTSTVKKINQADLGDFQKKFYSPAGMVVSFCGDFDKDLIIKMLKKKVSTNTKKHKPKFLPPKTHKGINIAIERKPLEQSHLCLGFRSVSYLSPQRIPALLMNVILGANMSSWLFEELREKRSLCYDVSTELRKYRDSGAFVVHTGLDKKSILLALKIILKTLGLIKKKDVSATQLQRAKDYLLGQIAMNLERPQGRMFYLAENYLTLGRIYDFNQIKRMIEGVKPTQIRTIAKKILNFQNICVSCVGNIDQDLEKKIRKFVIGI